METNSPSGGEAWPKVSEPRQSTAPPFESTHMWYLPMLTDVCRLAIVGRASGGGGVAAGRPRGVGGGVKAGRGQGVAGTQGVAVGRGLEVIPERAVGSVADPDVASGSLPAQATTAEVTRRITSVATQRIAGVCATRRLSALRCSVGRREYVRRAEPNGSLLTTNCYPTDRRGSSELAITESELKAMAAAATIGLRKPCSPKTGVSSAGTEAPSNSR